MVRISAVGIKLGLSNMIANPKYKGCYAGNKVKVIDLFTKKQGIS